MADELPDRTRPRHYAASELFLDLLWSVRSRAQDLDLETLLIFLIVNEASMRPLLVGPGARREFMNDPAPPAEARGAISRAVIADKSMLPRETVRRKVNQLIDLGLFAERRDGEVQAVPQLGEVMFQAIGDECHAAVERYNKRLIELGQPGIGAEKDSESDRHG